MTEILCIDSKFTPDTLQFYAKNGIKTPVIDKIYTPRAISKNSEGKYEVLLNEIINKEIPIKHKILGIVNKEPAWDLFKRFRNLDGTILTLEQVKEWKLEQKGILEPIKIKKDDENSLL